MGRILEVRAPFLLGIIDVIAVPSLALFFGTRIVRLGACAAAKACYEDRKKASNFAAGECVFHIFSCSQKMLPRVHSGKSFSLGEARETKDPASPYSRSPDDRTSRELS
jgi:hypothetical protein